MIFKNLFLLIVLFLVHFRTFAQDTNIYFSVTDSILSNSYTCKDINKTKFPKVKAVKNEALVDYIKKVYSKVIVQNDDIVKYGSATNLVIDKDKKLSGNVYFKLNDNGKELNFLSLGISGNTSDNFWDFFSKKSLKSGIGLNLGLDILKDKNKLYFNNNCDSILLIRKLHFYKHLDSLNKFYVSFRSRHDSITLLLKKLDSTINISLCKLHDSEKNINDSIKEFNNRIIKFINDTTKKDTINKLKLLVENKKSGLLDSIVNRRNKLNDSMKCFEKYFSFLRNRDSVAIMINSELIEFDKRIVSSVSNGYKLSWFRLNFNLTSQNYNIFDTSLFKNPDSFLFRQENYVNVSVSFIKNYVWDTKSGLKYLYVSLGYLNKFGLQGLSYNKNDSSLVGNDEVIVRKNDAEGYDLSRIDSTYNRSYNVFTLELGGFWFWGKNRNFGFEANIAVQTLTNVPSHINPICLVNARIGPIFTIGEGGKILSGGSTIALFAKSENWSPLTNKGNSFNKSLGFGIRLGIPFVSLKGLK